MGLIGFSITMLALDIMHCWHLGCGRDVCGAAIKLLCQRKGHYSKNTIAERLQQLMEEVKQFAKRHGKYLTFGRLKKSNVQWKADKCPELHCSASDLAIFLAFLAGKLQEVQLPDHYSGLTACLWAADMFVSGISSADFFLTEAERETLYVLGSVFLTTWAQLVLKAYQRGDLLFKLRPKYHMLVHLISDLRTRDSCRNPSVDSCWLEEDYVKWSLKKFRKLSRQTASLNLLKRCLVQQKDRLKVAAKEQLWFLSLGRLVEEPLRFGPPKGT